jgi:outer membrane protein assembly factor BamB/HEAT repeat protein
MLGVIADYLKEHRHELGKHALFVGSGVRLQPLDMAIQTLVEETALAYAGERVQAHAIEARPDAALAIFATELGHAERCRLVRERLGAGRTSEGHIQLSRLIKEGYVPTVFIMEPDDMLERALRAQHLEPEKDYHLLVAGLDEPEAIQVALEESTRVVVVKCGGDLERKFLPVTPEELSRVQGEIRKVIETTFRVFSVFVAYTKRDEPFLARVSRDGGKVFWINTMIPMRDKRLYDELRVESPASVEYHKYQPEVFELLEARHSSRHLLCREPGSFNDFFAKLHGRLLRRRRDSHRRRRDLSVLRGGPYRFLNYFDVPDSEFYFGREDDVEAVLQMVQQHRLSVLFGKSAIGKTSLLRAGLMARLKKETEDADAETVRPWLAAYARCEDDPIESIRNSIIEAADALGFDPSALADEPDLMAFVNGIADLTRRDVLVLLDQFEDYFVKLGARVREDFIETIAGCLNSDDCNLRLLLSVREDFVGELFELRAKLPEIMHHMYRVRKMSREQAENAIIKPAQNFDIQVERDLVTLMLDDLMRDGIEPAQLQIVCDRLYESLSHGSRVITQRIYERHGGAEKILSGYLDHMLNQFPLTDRRLARDVLKHMVASSELKAQRSLQRIAAEINEDREQVEKVLARLVDLRLIRSVGRDRNRDFELVHEYLAKDIAAWMSERQVAVKDVQDLVTRELNNYQKFGLLMDKGELRLIGDNRDELNLSPEELDLTIRSAVQAEVDVDEWFARVNDLKSRKRSVLASLLKDSADHVRRSTFERIGDHLDAALVPELVDGLHDPLPEVREQARVHLRSLERDLVTILGDSQNPHRRSAAAALGHIGGRRATRALLDALGSADEALRDDITTALRDLDDERTGDMLLRRLAGVDATSWQVAHAVGYLATTDVQARDLQRMFREHADSATYAYALGLVELHRRSFADARQALEAAAQKTVHTPAAAYVAKALEQLAETESKAAAGEDTWSQFGRSSRHEGRVTIEITPPLHKAWSYATKGQVVGSPVVVSGIVYVGSRDGDLHAIDARRGDGLWRLTTRDRIEGTPAVSGGRVFIGSGDGNLYSVNAQNGSRKWLAHLRAPTRSSCAVSKGRVYIGNRSGTLFCFTAEDGEEHWRFAADAEISATPAVASGVVVVGSWDNSIYGINADSGSKEWQVTTEDSVSSSAAIRDGIAYCGSDDRGVYAINISDGRLIWRRQLGGQVRSSPALADGALVVGCLDGAVYALSLDTGDVLWKTGTAEEVMASPAICGGIAYIGSKDGSLYALNLASGEIVWRHQTAFGVYATPAIAEATVFVALDYYDVVAFRPRS